jgi:hypothetical protein
MKLRPRRYCKGDSYEYVDDTPNTARSDVSDSVRTMTTAVLVRDPPGTAVKKSPTAAKISRDEAMTRGLTYHRTGRTAEAERLYKAVLATPTPSICSVSAPMRQATQPERSC